MKLFNVFKRPKTEMTLQQATAKIQELQTFIVEFQKSYAAAMAPDYSKTANPYNTKETQVQELLKKYDGTTTKAGKELVQRIINITAAFTLPNGVDLCLSDEFSAQFDKSEVDTTADEPTGDTNIDDASVEDETAEADAKPELDYIRAFLDENNINQGNALKFAQDANLQGGIAFKLQWTANPAVDVKPVQQVAGQIVPTETGKVKMTYLPWFETKWFIIPADSESNLCPPFKLKYKQLTLKINDTSIEWIGGDYAELEEKNFVFLNINDQLGKHIGMPRLGVILTTLEELSEDLSDWRVLNKLFAHPTPHFKCNNAAEVSQINTYLKNTGWRVGTALATTGEFKLISPQGTEVTYLEQGIITKIKIVSGATGINPHFMGFPDLLSNRSTADSMGEPTEVVTAGEIGLWEKFYESLFDKVIDLRNENNAGGVALRRGIVKPKLVPMSDRQWEQLKSFWLEALKNGGISLETFLAQIPKLDVKSELNKIRKESDAKAAEQAAQFDLQGIDQSIASGFNGGKQPKNNGKEDDNSQ